MLARWSVRSFSQRLISAKRNTVVVSLSSRVSCFEYTMPSRGRHYREKGSRLARFVASRESVADPHTRAGRGRRYDWTPYYPGVIMGAGEREGWFDVAFDNGARDCAVARSRVRFAASPARTITRLLETGEASDMCCFYMTAKWVMSCSQWAAGEKMCHLPAGRG